jgi:N-acetylglucosaminyl-diphospho-decaprenol L-rhamnosyltransferase
MTDHACVHRSTPSIAVVIVNYRTPLLALGAVAALAGERPQLPGLRVVLVDGGSGDDSAETLRTGVEDAALRDWVSLLALPINGGFGWANNQAMLMLMQSDAPPDYIHLLNPDARIEPGAVARLADILDRCPRCAVAGSLLLNEDGSASGSAFRFHSPARELVRGARTKAVGQLLGIKSVMVEDASADEVDWVTGASMMVRAAAIREVGLFDSGFFLYFEEVELMSRLARAGWAIRHEPSSRVRHIGGASTGMTYKFADLAVAPPLPAYWFQSRRRLFTRLQGRSGAVLAGLAWLTGHAFFMLRLRLKLGRNHVPISREGRDLVRHGLIPLPQDRIPAVTQWDDPPGKIPAWMERT